MSDISSLESSLRRRFRVIESRVDVGKRSLSILHPANAEELIDEEAFDRDERLPYWAELWPSARVMAGQILKEVGGGRTMLELGCGAGLVSTCASIVGFKVTASDYYEDAIRFARVNAVHNGAPAIRGLHLDWRDLPPHLPRFETVVASDVLYERQYGELVAKVLSFALAPAGTALLADPGRVGREAFLTALAPLGLMVIRRTDHAFRDQQIQQTISVFEIAWRA